LLASFEPRRSENLARGHFASQANQPWQGILETTGQALETLRANPQRLHTIHYQGNLYGCLTKRP
jgi:hypothetical protein